MPTLKVSAKEHGVDPSGILGLVTERVNMEMNESLTKPYNAKEISDALFQIGPLKAPGPDGFPARFYPRNWGELKEDVVKGVMEFFDSGAMPTGVNETVIVLIPKGNEPQTVKDYRPISLCNIIYKVVSKCLVNWL